MLLPLQKQNNIMKRKLFNIAWAIRNQFSTFAKALTHAWRVIRLYAELLTSNVRFQYKKIDGSIREATGTLAGAPPVKGTDRTPNYGVINYFDIEAQGWRSFRAENLITI